MFLHLSKGESVKTQDIIGIFDIENTTVSSITRDFLKQKQNNKQVVNLCDDLPKSFILAENGLSENVYITQISTISLKKRN